MPSVVDCQRKIPSKFICRRVQCQFSRVLSSEHNVIASIGMKYSWAPLQFEVCVIWLLCSRFCPHNRDRYPYLCMWCSLTGASKVEKTCRVTCRSTRHKSHLNVPCARKHSTALIISRSTQNGTVPNWHSRALNVTLSLRRWRTWLSTWSYTRRLSAVRYVAVARASSDLIAFRATLKRSTAMHVSTSVVGVVTGARYKASTLLSKRTRIEISLRNSMYSM